MMINYVNGDLFESIECYNNVHMLIPHVCNNIGRWGSGFVMAISHQWPTLLCNISPESRYHRWFKGELRTLCLHDRLGRTQFCRVPNPWVGRDIMVANMVAQNGVASCSNPHPLKYAALITCMKDVAALCVCDNCEIHAPKFGSALAGGNWDFIAELIEEIWCDIGIPVTIYEL